MALLAFCMLIFSVDYNIVYVALPEIGRDVGFSPQSLQWIVSAYAVGLGGFLLLGGRAVDRFGARRMLILALALYAVASLAGGATAHPGVLIGARVVQGVGGALLFPATLALITTTFPEGPARNKAFAWWGTAGASGVIVGAAAGGALTALLSWQWVFLVNVPLCGIAALGALRLLAKDVMAGMATFDVVGALLATAASTLLVYGLITAPEAGWAALPTVLTLTAGVALLAAFFAYERVARDPLAPPRMFGLRGLVAAMATIFAFQGAINALHYLFFVDVQNVLGYDPLEAGLAFLPVAVFAMLGSNRLLPYLVARFGVRVVLLLGMLGVGASMVVFAASMSTTGSYWTLLPSVVLWGLSAGTLYPAIFLAAGEGVPDAEQGVASGLTQTSAQLGGALGLAALVAVANIGLDLTPGAINDPAQVLAGLRVSALSGGISAALAAALALLVPAPAANPIECKP